MHRSARSVQKSFGTPTNGSKQRFTRSMWEQRLGKIVIPSPSVTNGSNFFFAPKEQKPSMTIVGKLRPSLTFTQKLQPSSGNFFTCYSTGSHSRRIKTPKSFKNSVIHPMKKRDSLTGMDFDELITRILDIPQPEKREALLISKLKQFWEKNSRLDLQLRQQSIAAVPLLKDELKKTKTKFETLNPLQLKALAACLNYLSEAFSDSLSSVDSVISITML